MPTHLASLRTVWCAAALFAGGLAITPAAHADGHCRYKKLSPGANLWYAACRMPASAKDCDEWAMTEGVSEAKFAEGACPTSGAVGACVVVGISQYFYSVSAKAAAEGCEHSRGHWQADSTPGS